MTVTTQLRCLPAVGLLLLASALAAQPERLPALPAFPGAEGGGAFTPGGRGGRVIAVTNLNDAGPGSFRAACEADGPRTVVFRVSGIITINSPVKIDHPFITIAGQTAPGDGVCVRGHTTEINTHDVIVRYMRFRRGNLQSRDDALGGYPVKDIIVDHVSASWGLDENLSLYRYMKKIPGQPDKKMAVENLTIQWCISSEALDLNNHAFGGTWGGANSSFHHNLFANNTGRNPSIGMTGLFDFRNNVVFNWRHRTADGGDSHSQINLVANYWKAGPATPPGPMQTRICQVDRRNNEPFNGGVGRWHVEGNFVAGHPEITANNWAGGVQYKPDTPAKDIILKQPTEAEARSRTPFPAPPVTQQSPEQAYELVLAYAGAILPVRDPVDVRITNEVRTGKTTYGNGIILRPDDVGGWPTYKAAEPPKDSDGDGIPDEWELKYGLNPNDPSDAQKDKNGDGYTNLEKYLNGIDPTQRVDYRDPKNNVNPLHKPLR